MKNNNKYTLVSWFFILVGIILFSIFDGKLARNYVKDNQWLELIRWSLEHISFFMSVSIASHLAYLKYIKKEELEAINIHLEIFA